VGKGDDSSHRSGKVSYFEQKKHLLSPSVEHMQPPTLLKNSSSRGAVTDRSNHGEKPPIVYQQPDAKAQQSTR
jgi:hypothetical protein